MSVARYSIDGAQGRRLHEAPKEGAGTSARRARVSLVEAAEGARRPEAERWRTFGESASSKTHVPARVLQAHGEAENLRSGPEPEIGREIIGRSTAWQQVLRKVEQVAPTDATVLVEGETGTGKELIARAIHELSPRRARALIKLNCGAISAGLVESELFGHERGAFTGALQKRVGRFELADGGTLFLDEIGELPLDAQVKLLRVLQEQEFERVGGSRSLRADVRIVAATNRDLAAEVRAGRFRSDLFYRLNVFPVAIPPLRERSSDIPPLVGHLLPKLSRKLGKPLHGVTGESLDRLMRHSWPGNVRELENVIERAAIVATGPVIEVEEPSSDAPSDTAASLGTRTLEEVERAHILAALEKTRGVVSGRRGAATVLGINASTLRSRMAKLGINRPNGEKGTF